MSGDPIVAETRRLREAFAKAYDYDLRRIVRALKRQEKAGQRDLVRLPSRQPRRGRSRRKAG
jgi:hypothetical protein